MQNDGWCQDIKASKNVSKHTMIDSVISWCSFSKTMYICVCCSQYLFGKLSNINYVYINVDVTKTTLCFYY